MSTDSGLLVVDVIDNSADDNGYLARCRQKHPNYLSCHGVRSMVDVVMNHVMTKGVKLSQLRIFGHGHAGSQAVGGGQQPKAGQKFWVEYQDGQYVGHNIGLLAPLRDYFTSNAKVLLHGCDVAAGKHSVGLALLRRLSHIWGGIGVFAAVFHQYAHTGGGFYTQYVGAHGQRIQLGGLDQYVLTKP